MGRVMKRRHLTLLAGLGSIFGLTTTMAESLEIGKAVPSVLSKNHKGEEVKIEEAAAEGWTLFFFYPKAATPG